MSGVPGSCRSCGYTHLETVLSLGRTPLANAFLTADQLGQPEPAYPLDLAFCSRCALVQILETVPPDVLFKEYLYFSSFSDTMLRHAGELASRLIESRRLGPGSLVVELASNDGYLLKYFVQNGIPVLGIEPAANVAQVAQEQNGVLTLCEFFGAVLAEKLANDGQHADVILALNVLGHVADTNGFVRGIQLLLKEDGVAVIEVPYVKDMIDRCEFDTIYHEHLCYFSVTALDRLFQRHGLVIHDVERVEFHGGSLRLSVAHPSTATDRNTVRRFLEEEAAWGVGSPGFYRSFGGRVRTLRESLRALVAELRQSRKRIAAYGAAAKGSTLLNYCGFDRQQIEFVVDRSTYKQGRYMPGTHLPIYAPTKLLDDMPDYVLLLTWNYAEEILHQQAEYQACGGRFIIPIPELKIV